MSRTPQHLIRTAKTHAIGREQDVFLEGAKYGHENPSISSAVRYDAFNMTKHFFNDIAGPMEPDDLAHIASDFVDMILGELFIIVEEDE